MQVPAERVSRHKWIVTSLQKFEEYCSQKKETFQKIQFIEQQKKKETGVEGNLKAFKIELGMNKLKVCGVHNLELNSEMKLRTRLPENPKLILEAAFGI